MNINPQQYRLFYTIVAILGLTGLLFYTVTIDSTFFFRPVKATKLIGLLLASWGFFIMKAAFKSYDLRAFLGLRSLETEYQFVTTGLLQKVRHPLYSGSIVFIVGYITFNPKWSSLLSGVLMIAYFLIGIQFEEQKLIKTFGQKYLDYKKNTPMLIPRLGKKNPRRQSSGE